MKIPGKRFIHSMLEENEQAGVGLTFGFCSYGAHMAHTGGRLRHGQKEGNPQVHKEFSKHI